MWHIKLATALYARAHVASSSLAKRATEGEFTRVTNSSAGYWFVGLAFLNVLIFVPILIYLTYTLYTVIPLLAIVESRSNYQRLSLHDDNDLGGDTKRQSTAIEHDGSESRPVTSSLRATHQVLYSISGWRSLFRGLGCLMVVDTCRALLTFAVSFGSIIPSPIPDIIATLLLVQLSTVWLHLVITTPKAKSFSRRLPDFKTTFRATAIPNMIMLAAVEITVYAPELILRLIHVDTERPYIPLEGPKIEGNVHGIWKVAIFFGVYLVAFAFLYIPAQVILARTQAALLSEEYETIVPFDRTFGVETAGGKQSLSVSEAWKSFSGSWGRLYKLYVKAAGINYAVQILVGLVIGLEFVLLTIYGQKK
ncbi:hypothetical protein BJ170DRAFT_692327 [Xylariales sp. AK1849]|nr:hypothetical protein BJ170DRAFT_692327 [Xylariales sp. AK1849]